MVLDETKLLRQFPGTTLLGIWVNSGDNPPHPLTASLLGVRVVGRQPILGCYDDKG
jgi:hypothetical protein